MAMPMTAISRAEALRFSPRSSDHVTIAAPTGSAMQTSEALTACAASRSAGEGGLRPAQQRRPDTGEFLQLRIGQAGHVVGGGCRDAARVKTLAQPGHLLAPGQVARHPVGRCRRQLGDQRIKEVRCQGTRGMVPDHGIGGGRCGQCARRSSG